MKSLLTLAMTCLLVLVILSSQPVVARSGCLAGTYLVAQEDGTQSLWTLSGDRTLQITSSAEAALGFSHEQGVWQQVGSRRAKLAALDFNFDLAGGVPPSSVARVDAVITFSKKCQSLQGTFELRFFDTGSEDPLDPDTDLGDAIPGRFTGRRLTLAR